MGRATRDRVGRPESGQSDQRVGRGNQRVGRGTREWVGRPEIG